MMTHGVSGNSNELPVLFCSLTDRVCQQQGLSLWVPFQNAATAVTNLYRGTLGRERTKNLEGGKCRTGSCGGTQSITDRYRILHDDLWFVLSTKQSGQRHHFGKKNVYLYSKT